MVTVKLRYKKPDGDKSQLIERSLMDTGSKFANASTDLKFAAAVAEFGMLLRDSQYKGNGTMGAVMEWAQEGKRRRCKRLSRWIYRARAQDAIADQGLEIFRRLNCRGRFHAHGEKCPQEQNPSSRAVLSQTFPKNPGGQSKRTKRTKELQCLREGDADFLNRDVVENVRDGDAGHGGNDKNEIHVSANM